MSHRPELLFNTSTPQKTSKHPSIHETIRASSYQPSQSSINTSAPQPPLTGVALLFHCSTQETPTPPRVFLLKCWTYQAQRGAEKVGDLTVPALQRWCSARKARNGGEGRRGQRAFSAGGEVQFWRSAVLNLNVADPLRCPPNVSRRWPLQCATFRRCLPRVRSADATEFKRH